MKKIGKLLVLSLCLMFVITGCSNSDEELEVKTYDTIGLNHTTCTRDAYATDADTDISINIDIYYDDEEYIKILNTVEKITSNNDEVLSKYENAYKNIYKAYKDIDYYDNTVVRNDNSVTSTTTINYGKVNMDKVMKIEGEEDNVKVVDGKIKLSDWKSFAKKYGTTCN